MNRLQRRIRRTATGAGAMIGTRNLQNGIHIRASPIRPRLHFLRNMPQESQCHVGREGIRDDGRCWSLRWKRHAQMSCYRGFARLYEFDYSLVGRRPAQYRLLHSQLRMRWNLLHRHNSRRTHRHRHGGRATRPQQTFDITAIRRIAIAVIGVESSQNQKSRNQFLVHPPRQKCMFRGRHQPKIFPPNFIGKQRHEEEFGAIGFPSNVGRCRRRRRRRRGGGERLLRP
mmetsp:Transcript_8787/g.18754  ORF Transcript_8787/g.18754 Transcript_8787/m.18754 type:complete len:228 (+) Transcript_8787:3043-3726(+)